jgi:hypothetical protein
MVDRVESPLRQQQQRMSASAGTASLAAPPMAARGARMDGSDELVWRIYR